MKRKRICFTYDERRRRAVRGEVFGRKVPGDVVSIATRDTILVWDRKLVAQK